MGSHSIYDEKGHKYRKITGQSQLFAFLDDPYHWLQDLNYFWIFFLSFVVYLLLVAFFALLLFIPCAAGADWQEVWLRPQTQEEAAAILGREGQCSYARAFFFSYQTFGTIGYGYWSPLTEYGNSIVLIESVISFLYSCIMGAVVYHKASRPSRLRHWCSFSKVAVLNSEHRFFVYEHDLQRETTDVFNSSTTFCGERGGYLPSTDPLVAESLPPNSRCVSLAVRFSNRWKRQQCRLNIHMYLFRALRLYITPADNPGSGATLRGVASVVPLVVGEAAAPLVFHTSSGLSSRESSIERPAHPFAQAKRHHSVYDSMQQTSPRMPSTGGCSSPGGTDGVASGTPRTPDGVGGAAAGDLPPRPTWHGDVSMQWRALNVRASAPVGVSAARQPPPAATRSPAVDPEFVELDFYGTFERGRVRGYGKHPSLSALPITLVHNIDANSPFYGAFAAPYVVDRDAARAALLADRAELIVTIDCADESCGDSSCARWSWTMPEILEGFTFRPMMMIDDHGRFHIDNSLVSAVERAPVHVDNPLTPTVQSAPSSMPQDDRGEGFTRRVNTLGDPHNANL